MVLFQTDFDSKSKSQGEPGFKSWGNSFHFSVCYSDLNLLTDWKAVARVEEKSILRDRSGMSGGQGLRP